MCACSRTCQHFRDDRDGWPERRILLRDPFDWGLDHAGMTSSDPRPSALGGLAPKPRRSLDIAVLAPGRCPVCPRFPRPSAETRAQCDGDAGTRSISGVSRGPLARLCMTGHCSAPLASQGDYFMELQDGPEATEPHNRCGHVGQANARSILFHVCRFPSSAHPSPDLANSSSAVRGGPCVTRGFVVGVTAGFRRGCRSVAWTW